MRAAIRLALISVPLALGLQSLDYESGGYTRRYSDEISATSAAGGEDAPESSRTPDEAEQPNTASEPPQEGHVEFSLLGVKSSPSLFTIGQNQKSSPSLFTIGQNQEAFSTESNRQLFGAGVFSGDPEMKKAVLGKVAKSIADDKRGFFSHLSKGERAHLAKQVADEQDTSFVDVVAPPSMKGRPVLVPPRQTMSTQGVASFIESSSSGKKGSGSGNGDFQPSSDFQDSAATLVEAGQDLPWGVGSPKTGDSLPVFHYSGMPSIDAPKEWEYSLDSGDNIQSFSSAQQDVKLITQVLFNVTNGFYLDTNAGDGEHPSNTLLMELAGWRGLILEPRGYQYLDLWSKMRKAWLFLGCISPHENATKIGFDTDGNIDMLSGHMIHAYNMKDFMAEMGGRTTIDFWNLHSGGYEAEILKETLLGVGSFLEFGVILVRFDGRRTGRGYDSFVTHRSKDETEELIFEILHNASFKYIGGLDAYWINHVSPRYHYNDVVWVNPAYFASRGIPEPKLVKAAPPPPLSYPGNAHGHEFTSFSRKESPWPIRTDPNEQYWPGYDSWDSGFSPDKEIEMVVSYLKKSKADAARQEPMPMAHRVASTKLVD